jgi:hypothetical protein
MIPMRKNTPGARRTSVMLSMLALSALAIAACGSTTTKTVTVTAQAVPPKTGPVSAEAATLLVGRFAQVWDEQYEPGLYQILTGSADMTFEGIGTWTGLKETYDNLAKNFFVAAQRETEAHYFTVSAIKVGESGGGTYVTGNYNSPNINGTTGTFRFDVSGPTPDPNDAGDPCIKYPCISRITLTPTGKLKS